MPTALQRWLPTVALGTSLVAACSAGGARERGESPIQLIVLISVDQLPAYLLERYDSLFGGGLRRLLDEGRSYTRAVHDHAFTVTAPGHATLTSGVVPARHGVVANDWQERVDGDWVWVNSVRDAGERIPGLPHLAGRSPRQLQATALPDWIRAAHADSRIVSLSGKARAAILMAGRTRGHVYWFEDDVGRFVTSTYYRDAYPGWVDRFNDDGLALFFADSTWELTVPGDAHRFARSDASEFEYDGIHTTFPHRFSGEVAEHEASEPEAFYDWWEHTPLLDRAILKLAEAAVTAHSLGRRGSADLLALGLSGLDRVGHRFGPLSLEQLDALLRLDRGLGEFFAFLDATVGAGRYLVGFSSDHGVLPIPEYQADSGLPGRRLTGPEVWAERRAVDSAEASSPPATARTSVVEALERLDFIADVITLEELAGGEPADSFVALYQRSYYPGRIKGPLAPLGLVVRRIEGAHASSAATTHGTPYYYDRHVPLIIMAPDVPAGSSAEPVRTVDLAPSLAELAGIPYPADRDGRPLVAAAPRTPD